MLFRLKSISPLQMLNNTSAYKLLVTRILPSMLCCWILLAAVSPAEAAAEPKKHDPHRWDKQIAAFEKADLEKMPPRNGILFVGSSSIRAWNLKKSFPGMPVINRGFGGSEIADSLFFANRLIIKHQPRIIVLYAGDNDLARGKTSQQVVSDYQAFVKKIRAALPKSKIVFVAIKPSIARWALIRKIRQSNKQIQQITTTDPLQVFLDIDTPMIGTDGKPKPELFLEDGLHLNVTGYKLWNSLLRPVLKSP